MQIYYSLCVVTFLKSALFKICRSLVGLDSIETNWEIACLDIDSGEIFFCNSVPLQNWAADPFLFEFQNQNYLFVELFDEHKRKGSIAFCVFRDGHFGEFIVCLEEDFHLSFPRIIVIEGKIYMTVESSTEPGLRIYQAKNFPFSWELRNVFCDSRFFLDPILITDSNRIFFICTEILKSQVNELKLFQVTALQNSRLQDSPSNSISQFSPNSRNGGFFQVGERFVRVIQRNFLGIYGYNLDLSEILRPIDFFDYRENNVTNTFLKKPIFARQFHTLNKSGKYFVFDFKR